MNSSPRAIDDDPPVLAAPQLDPAWFAAATEPILDPGRRIIDGHFHFSEHWGGYGLDDLLRDTASGHRVEATVFIQCDWRYRTDGAEPMKPVGETEAAVQFAEQAQARGARTAIAAAIVGFADLRLGAAVDDVLIAHREAGKGRFRGVRYVCARHEAFRHGVSARPPAGLHAEARFREGVRRLGSHGLTFDTWVYHTQLEEVLDLARAVPGTTIVIDHLGGLLGVGPYAGRPQEAFEQWRRLIKPLAACPNVVMKIGGYGIATFGHRFPDLPAPPSSSALAEIWRPSADTVIDAFGTRRCLFESNFPVDRACGHYATVWNAFKRLASGASETEKADLFYDTAARVYRIGADHPA